MSIWCYSRPSKAKRSDRWISEGFQTREAAMQEAVSKSCKRDITDPDLIKQLWSSLYRAGWKIELK